MPAESSQPNSPRRAPILAIAFAGLVLLVVIGSSLHAEGVGVSPKQVVLVIARHVPLLGGYVKAPTQDVNDIVWQIRLPRMAVAILIGVLLGYAGAALQGLLMNPLADPYTVGVSAGAAVGAAGAEVMGWSALAYGFAGAGTAFATALAAVALVYGLARVNGRVSVHSFLLAGVVVGTFLWSLIPLLLYLAGRQDQIRRVLFYLIGSLDASDWTRAGLLAPFAVIMAVCLRAWAKELNLMSMGEETAAHLGVPVESFKRRSLVIASLATAAAVSVGGVIGFVGLVVPHLARRIIGPDHRGLLPLAAIFGAILLVASDTVARVYLHEIPVGVVTSLIGAPVFCYLLRRKATSAW